MLAHQHRGLLQHFPIKKVTQLPQLLFIYFIFAAAMLQQHFRVKKIKLKLQVRAFELRFFQAEFYDVSGGVFRGQSLAERNGNVVGKTRSKFLAQDVAAGGVAARGGPDLL